MQEREDVGTAEGFRDVKDEVAERMGEAASDVKRGALRAVDEASQAIRDARERLAAAYGRTAQTAERTYLDARSYAKENPGVAAAVTFAAGLGLGMMLAARYALGRRG